MQIYEELKARGLIAQVTNEEEIREMVNTGKAVFYIGFDPTADSLHVAIAADRERRKTFVLAALTVKLSLPPHMIREIIGTRITSSQV